jgi:hypothetical protein
MAFRAITTRENHAYGRNAAAALGGCQNGSRFGTGVAVLSKWQCQNGRANGTGLAHVYYPAKMTVTDSKRIVTR